jgi:hypothetical protein
VKIRAVGLLAVLVLAAGCGDDSPDDEKLTQPSASATSVSPTPSPTLSPPPNSTPYSLYVHCGVEWLPLGGKVYRTKRLANADDSGPPGGWANPEQPGWLTRTSPTTVRFTASTGVVAGKVVDFTLHTAPRPTPPLCL